MGEENFDIIIFGAGFSGSLTALIANRLGFKVALLEKGRHPRFAVGESSTPLANLMLERIAKRYGLTWLEPFCKYGLWKDAHPDIACGLKRGFSFYHHAPGKPFKPRPGHPNELLVEANPNEERGDTHWFRSEFDAFLADRVIESGITYYDGYDAKSAECAKAWHFRGTRGDRELTLSSPFAIDATTGTVALSKAVGVRTNTKGMRSATRTLFGHFENVAEWADILSGRGHDFANYPFHCDDSALHHIIDGGWMWVLRFDNGITSAGFSLDPARHPQHVSPDAEWRNLMRQYPSLRRQFIKAKPVMPLISTDRIQRRIETAAGENWAALPHAACFVDPFLSTGIAHSLFGVERLARIMEHHWASPERKEHLDDYARAIYREMRLIDTIVSACFTAFDRFDAMAAMSMLYFTAAIYSEEAMRAGTDAPGDEYLLAHDERFKGIVTKACKAVYQSPPATPESIVNRVRRLIEPYNLVGLCNPERENMYPFLSATMGGPCPSDMGDSMKGD